MSLIITDADAERLISIPEAVEAMRLAFRDLAEGRAVNPPRLRYSAPTPDPARRYTANIHAGAVASAGVACVRAGSAFAPVEQASGRKVNVADDVNYSIIILYDLHTGEPLAFMHETYLSGLRVGATSALAVSLAAREDAGVLGLFGTGMQAVPNCKAICAVRPIRRVKVFSPNPAHRAAFVERMAGEAFETIAVDDPREVVRGAHVVACMTNSKVPVLNGDWLEGGQVVITIANSDVINARHEVDETTFARASEIIINDWDSVEANRQVELSGPIASSGSGRLRAEALANCAFRSWRCVPVAFVARAPLVLVVNSDLPVKSLPDLVKLARATPGGLSYTSVGAGSAQHLSGEFLKRELRIDMTHVPFGGPTPALAAVAGGHVALMFGDVLNAMPLVEAGKIRPIAMTNAASAAVFQNVPTFMDAGLRGFDSDLRIGIFAPAQTPGDIVARLNSQIRTATADAAVHARFSKLGVQITDTPAPEENAKIYADELARWQRLVKDANLDKSQ